MSAACIEEDSQKNPLATMIDLFGLPGMRSATDALEFEWGKLAGVKARSVPGRMIGR
jgi:hypothetical protein